MVADREAQLGRIVEQLISERAHERIGSIVDVLVDRVIVVKTTHQRPRASSRADAEGRADHQAPEVDGTTLLPGVVVAPGTIVSSQGRVIGADLIADARPGRLSATHSIRDVSLSSFARTAAWPRPMIVPTSRLVDDRPVDPAGRRANLANALTVARSCDGADLHRPAAERA